MGPTFEADVMDMTWALGSGGNLGPNCTGKWKTEDIRELQMGGMNWIRTKEHSKWAIAGDYVCIGDINRQPSQMIRGGGSICFKDSELSGQIRDSIVQIDTCSDDE
jgi:deoxyribonuclease-2